jgi:16S rRNA (cytosine1402-N4)-methyltransferase
MKELPIGSEYHVPVLVDEVLDGLQVKQGTWYIDGTIGGGGHAEQILAAGGMVLGIDQDEQALASTRQRLHESVSNGLLRLVKANFRDLAEVWRREDIGQVQGVLLDLGVSSHQLNEPERGFRFDAETLDMRMDASLPVTAADLIARLGGKDLEQLFVDWGEERYARHFANVIVDERVKQPITSAKQLADLLYRVSPPPYRRGPIHPATRVFQALRLAVNAELDSLQDVLPQAVEVLVEGGRLAVISFHSLEDRIVKRFMLDNDQLLPITKRPVEASGVETAANPRSRSAKLRVAVKAAVEGQD